MNEVPARLAAALSDRYSIEREIGAGGMATVYLAHDVKHDRKVALKVLKPDLAAVLGADRFVVEIRTTASLQHPHILPLFDSGTADGFLYYVMPFIDGETLRARLDRETQLGIEESVRIATDVASALHYAHTHGVIHRDIKPENILLHDGRPVVADFGIALAVSAAAGGRMTETGLSLGTPHYMSPEQATADKDIGARSDIYSLASVLYEMLTGEPPHMGNSAQQIIMKIIADTPRPVAELRKAVPPHIGAAVAMALEKLPADRFDSAKAFAEALGNKAFTTTVAGATGQAAHRGVSNRVFAGTAVVAAIAIVAALAGWVRPDRSETRVLRYEDGLVSDSIFGGAPGSYMALSPDGNTIAFRGGNLLKSRIYIRQRDRLTATPLDGTENGTTPFFSPDGKQIGFCVRPTPTSPCEWKKVPAGGGAALPLAVMGPADGAAWAPDGMIYVRSIGGLARIPESGGTPVPFTRIDSASGEQNHRWPTVLPGGGILFIAATSSGVRLAAADAKGKHKVFVVSAIIAKYLHTGHVAYVTAEGMLMVAPFDPRRLAVTGEGVAVAEGIGVRRNFVVDLDMSSSGTLVYSANSANSVSGDDEVAWVNRDGTDRGGERWLADFGDLALSPDGGRLAVTIRVIPPSSATNSAPAPTTELWVRQGERGALSKLTFASGGSVSEPRWTTDGHSLAYSATIDGKFGVWLRRADGSAPATALFTWDRAINTIAWAPDGALLMDAAGPEGRDIFTLRPGTDSVPKLLFSEPGAQSLPAVSPDGRWLAYASTETGRAEVYVRPYPNVNASRTPVTSQGGSQPGWSKSLRELFYVRRGSDQGDQVGEMHSVMIPPGNSFTVGEDRILFTQPRTIGYWGVTPDGQRFAVVRGQRGATASGNSLIVVENWFAELKAKLITER